MGKNIKISVIGAGRFGSFLGKELSRFYDVIYYDKNKSRQDFKSYKGINECLSGDIIFIALPISEIESFLKENSTLFSSNAVLVDMASVKLKPKEFYEKHLPEGIQFMLTHPLFGPDSAKITTEGEKIVITESRINIDAENILLKIFGEQLRLKIIYLTADEHDYLMAFNLSLMHHLGRAFEEMGITGLKLKMKSLTDISRITQFVMNDSELLFRDFYRFNPYSHSIREEFEASFKKISSLL